MSKFGEDLRMERISRGIALEEITAVTKIAQRHLIALEQERFRLLPGGILSKGIVRGYASALGLDPNTWTERFLTASGEANGDENWTAFASNVGRARLLKHEAAQIRLRWVAAALFAFVVLIAGFMTFRYYGVRVGWWPHVLPAAILQAGIEPASQWIHALMGRFRA